MKRPQFLEREKPDLMLHAGVIVMVLSLLMSKFGLTAYDLDEVFSGVGLAVFLIGLVWSGVRSLRGKTAEESEEHLEHLNSKSRELS